MAANMLQKPEDRCTDVERIMRRAEDLGFDPQRVARALGHQPAHPPERDDEQAPRADPRRVSRSG